jgi:lipid-A-disaccharide synthase
VSDAPRVLVVAGEASGDNLAAGLIRAVRKRRPGVSFAGVAGPRMAEAGCERLYDSHRLSVVGLTEVLRHFMDIRRVFKGLLARLRADPPDLLICVDLPDFNLRLARHARKLGIPVVYYVSPQVWAWRRGRLKTIGRRVDHMLVIYPFEEPFYREAGIRATFVGHPMVERIPQDPDPTSARRELGLSPDRPVAALLPGSRRAEVARLAPVLAGAAQRLGQRYPHLQFVVPVAGEAVAGELEPYLDAGGPEVVRATDSVKAVAAADVAAVASGTATLETAVVGTPEVILYKVSPLTYFLARRLVKVPFIGIVNLVAEREVAPELVQSDATPDRVAALLGGWLADEETRQQVRQGLAGVRERLGEDCSARAAEVVLDYLPAGHG